MERITKAEYMMLRKAGVPHVRDKRKTEYRTAMVVTRTKRGYWRTDV